MKVIHFTALEAMPINDPNVSGVSRRVLISAKDNAPNFTMRLFHVEPGGYTYYHSHDFEHEIFVIEGQGEAIGTDGATPISAGTAIFVAPNEVHQLRNTGNGRMSFLCLVPNRGHQ